MAMSCLFNHKWDGDKCAVCGQARDEYEFFMKMIALLEEGSARWIDEARSRGGVFDYMNDEFIQVVHQARQAIRDRCGKEGLDTVMDLLKAKDSIAQMDIVEDNWQH